MIIAADVAKWMFSEFEREHVLYQETAVWDIQQKFGNDFIYENQNGNVSISKEVLAEFRKLTGNKVVWVRTGKYWRFGEISDEQGRRQDG